MLNSSLTLYRVELRKLVVSYTAVIAGHYLVVFPLLVIYYCRILHYIKKLKRVNGELAKCASVGDTTWSFTVVQV